MSPAASNDPRRRKAAGPIRKGGARKPLPAKRKTAARRAPASSAAQGTAKAAAKDAAPKPATVRLNKFLADRGVDSRRKCDELIVEGKVTVNGATVTELGLKVDTSRDTVEVAGFVFRADEEPRKRYYLLNKPPGVVCTNERRELRPRAVDLISDRQKGRIYTVGRLDEESKGLVLLTNDGDFAHRIMHPSHQVPKTYAVKVRGPVDDEALQKVRQGVHLAEGRTGGARVVVFRRTRDYTHLLVTLFEGKNREVRRVFARVGSKLAELKRVRIGNLTDKGLKVGTWRPLLRAEVRELLELSEGRGKLADVPEETPPERAASARPKSFERPLRRPARAQGDPREGERRAQRRTVHKPDPAPAAGAGRERRGSAARSERPLRTGRQEHPGHGERPGRPGRRGPGRAGGGARSR